jgi:hypothetical protein
MVSMASNTLSLEQCREPETRRYLLFRDEVIGALGLVNDELGGLPSC